MGSRRCGLGLDPGEPGGPHHQCLASKHLIGLLSDLDQSLDEEDAYAIAPD
jgi:hypothetical protein